jgi:lactoylglutathione lyase
VVKNGRLAQRAGANAMREDSMAIVPIQGLWETHLTVADLDRSIAFYRDVVGLTLAHIVPERHVAFFWIGQPRQAMLGLWSIHTSPLALRLHYAFQVTLDDVKASVAALRRAGLEPVSGGGGRPIDEPEVLTWIPAASVYFRDPDGHSLEFIAMLPEPPRPELPRVPLSEWNRLHTV